MNPFQLVAGKKVRRNKFDLSQEKKLSLKMGKLYPILCEEVLPGDSFRVNSESLLRFAPMIAPVMHRMNVYIHYFFVPNRLIWDNWENFITGGRNGDQLPDMPYITIQQATINNFQKGTVSDYLGLPTFKLTDTITEPVQVSSLPFRAYVKIFNEYYRDPNLQGALPVGEAIDGNNNGEIGTLTLIRQRAWEKDYFTSALPWSQRGAEVELGLQQNFANPQYVYDQDGQKVTNYISGEGLFAGNSTGQLYHAPVTGGANDEPVSIGIDNVGININDLRKSVRLQEWLERTARGGYRYVEQILSHFGVKSSDARLQRPEYLGGGRQPVVISEVLNTAGGETPQGQMSGHGISVGSEFGFKKYFEEHGFVMGIMSVIPKTSYQQGIHRSFKRFDKFDFYFPEFANLGEQEILDMELFFDGSKSGRTTFGYQSRYAEYKYGKSTVHGDFRDDLSFYHMGRIFTSEPSLNSSFTSADPTTRIFAVESGDNLYANIYHNISAVRPMPYFSNPIL